MTTPAGLNPLSLTLVERLTAERDRLQHLLARLSAIHAEVEEAEVVEQLVEAAREVVAADFGIYVGLAGEAPLHVLGAGPDIAFEDVPAPSLAPLLAASFSGGPPLRVDDITRWALSEDAARPYGSLRGGQVIRSYLAASVSARSGAIRNVVRIIPMKLLPYIDFSPQAP